MCVHFLFIVQLTRIDFVAAASLGVLFRWHISLFNCGGVSLSFTYSPSMSPFHFSYNTDPEREKGISYTLDNNQNGPELRIHSNFCRLGGSLLPRLGWQGIIGRGGSITNVSTETHGKLSILKGEEEKSQPRLESWLG